MALRRMHLALLASLLSLAGPGEARGEEARDRVLSRDLDVVYAALAEIESKKDASAARALLEAALSTPHPHVAVLCGDVARALGPQALGDAEVRATAEKASAGADPGRQANLARFLAATRDARFDDLLARLAAARDLSVEMESLQCCAGMGRCDPLAFEKTAAAVGRALRSPKEEVRAVACAAAGHMGLLAEADVLVKIACAGGGVLDAAFAAVACRRLGISGRMAAVKRALGEAVHVVQLRPVLRTLSLVGGPDDVKALTEILKSPKEEAREGAARGLALLLVHDPGAAPSSPPAPPPSPEPAWADAAHLLVDMALDDKFFGARDAARVAVLRIGAPARPYLAARVPAAFDTGDSEIAAQAAEMAAGLGMAEALPDLLRVATSHEDPARRMAFARAAGRLSLARAVERLAALVTPAAKATAVHIRAARALGYAGGREAIDALLPLLEAPGYSEDVRAECERSLERLTGRRFGRSSKRWAAWISSVKDPLLPALPAFDRAVLRRQMSEGPAPAAHPDAERAVERGLRWLEREQRLTGEWVGAEKGYGGRVEGEALYTGECALAFLGAGYRGTAGRFRETVRRAADCLAARMLHDGGFASGAAVLPPHGEALSNALSFSQPSAADALIEAAVLGGDPDLRPFAQRAVDGLVRTQTLGSSWPPTPRALDPDTATAAIALPALLVARAGGLEVPQRALDGVDAWLEECSSDVTGLSEEPADLALPADADVDPRPGRLAYAWHAPMALRDRRDFSKRVDSSLTEMGMALRLLEGWPRTHPFLVGGARVLMATLPEWDQGAAAKDVRAIPWRSTYWEFGLLSIHAMGGSRWRTWSERVRRLLAANQRSEPDELDGSWDPDVRHSHDEGRLEATAKDCLALEAPYRFPLPLSR